MSARMTTFPKLLKQVLSEPLSDHDDRQLLERFADQGDESAFAALVDRHGGMLLGVCRRMLGDTALAEDVVQATFLVLARKARSIRRRESLASWLHGVARRLANQVRLAEAARTRRERRVADQRGEAVESDPAWSELLRVLDEELQRLPEANRAPLLLCYLEGRTLDEAAGQLGWSLSTLRRRLERGRTLLRTRMVRRGATLGAGLLASALLPVTARAALTPSLRRIVLNSVLSDRTGAELPATVIALANSGTRCVSVARLCTWAALVLAATGFFAGLAWRRGEILSAEEQPAQVAPAVEPAPSRDRFNDPLPGGAVVRCGTLSFRHGRVFLRDASLAFTPDGKALFSTGGGWVRRWDVANGFAAVTAGEGGRDGLIGTALATADGKVARLSRGGWRITEYDLENGSERRTYELDFPKQGLHGPPGYLSPDGKWHAERSPDGEIILWNAADGTIAHQWKRDGLAYTTLAFTPDGKTVLVGDEVSTVRAFDLATGRETRSFGVEKGDAMARMVVSPDGKWLATVGGAKLDGRVETRPADPFIRLWDLTKGAAVQTLCTSDEVVCSLVFTADSQTLFMGAQDGGPGCVVRSWDVATGKAGRSWTEDPALGPCVAVSPDGRTLATMNERGVICLWDCRTGKEIRPLEASPGAVYSACFGPDGKTLRTADDGMCCREWETATGRLLRVTRAEEKGTFLPGLTANGKLFTTSFARDENHYRVQLRDAVSGKLVVECAGLVAIAGPDGKRIAVPAQGEGVRILEAATGKVLRTLRPTKDETTRQAWFGPVAFTADGRSLVTVGESLVRWDLDTGERRSSWGLVEKKVLDRPARSEPASWEQLEGITLSPDGGRIAFGLRKDRPTRPGNPPDWFGRVMILETETGKLLQQFDLKDTFECLAFSPDGKRLAGGGEWTVYVWDAASGKALQTFEGHRGRIKSVAFSPDGKRLASASEDSTVLIWDTGR